MDRGRAPHSAGLSRRTIIRGAFWFLGAIAAGVFASMTTRFESLLRKPREVTIPPDGDDGITFVGGVVVSRERQHVRVFAAQCTHLGCRLSHAADGVIVCPCHGSKFRADGSVASGPATRPLAELAYRIDSRTGALVVYVA